MSGSTTAVYAPLEAPLSITQERLWFLCELNDDYSLFNTATAVRLERSINLSALQNALRFIAQRHQPLRTMLHGGDGSVPVQRSSGTPAIELDMFSLSPEDQLESELGRVMAEITARPFDLFREFPWRTVLLQLQADQHVLLLVAHRMFFDSRSKEIIFRELATAYSELSQGGANPLAPPRIEFSDHVAAERQYLESEALKSDLAFWQQKLSGLRAPELPTDRPRPAHQSYRGAEQSLAFGDPLSEQLKTLSDQTKFPLVVVLLAAFKTLLCRYTGEEDVAIAWSVPGRLKPELEELIGCFENTLVSRTDLSGNPPFTELLARVDRTATEALQHQNVPFATLVKEFVNGVDRSRSPLVQTMFAHEPITSAAELSGVRWTALQVPTGRTEFDLILRSFDTAAGLSATLEYSTDLFDPATITRMLRHFETLLQSIVANPGQRISALPMLTEAEAQQLIVDWNSNRKNYRTDRCIYQLFEAQVEQSPDSIAVACGDRELTYRELNSRANQLAHYLRQMGTGPEVLVGICLKRSLDMVIGLLGILKAGGAYVPLDPAYPKERLAFVLEDAQISLLLTEHELLDIFPTTNGPRRLCLDTEWPQIAKQKDTNPQPPTTAKNLAYIIYTSGSTGKPKGVAIENFSVTTFLCWAHSVFSRQDLTGVLASTSICFDLSVFELFAPLTCGGKVIMAENALALPTLRNRDEVRLVNMVPSAIAELVRTDGIPRSVQIINLAGEPLSTSLVQQIYRISSVERVYDLYGPSEDTTYSTFTLRTPDGPKTIGRPISNTQVYIVDRLMNPVPVGIPGRLYIGGDGLARGYLNRPELTAEKFITDRFTDIPGARLYDTGDLARYLPDGNIEFLGRIDNQVKVRGFRIELGEIEAVLCQRKGVRDAVAIVREDMPNQKSVVAYVTLGTQEPVPALELKRYLESKLPPYMVPSAVMVLDNLPLTPNGKVDRRALPVPEQRSGLAQGMVSPRTPTQASLARIWATLLQTDQIGIQDNFFELGGDSLLALRLIDAVNKEFHRSLPLTAIFQAPTIEQLGKQLAGGITLPTWSSLYGIQPHGSKSPFFWIHGENSDAFLPRYLGPDQPLYGVRHQSEDGNAARYRNIPDIAAHYLSEIREAQPHGPYFLGGYCIGSVVAFEIACQLKNSQEDVRLVVMLEPDNLADPEASRGANPKLLAAGIYRRWEKLSSLPAREKARYVLWRASERLNEQRIKSTYNLCFALGRPIPAAMRRDYIVNLYDAAMTHYIPSIYSGRLTIIKLRDASDKNQWERLALEGVDFYEISGNHQAILNEPHVREWAEVVADALARAQTREKSKHQARALPTIADRMHSVGSPLSSG